MSLRLRAFSVELSKIAESSSKKDSKKKKKGYGAALVATAPAAVVQSAADYPKGWTDKKVETLVAKGPREAKLVKAWKTGAGRAAGRLGAGVLTAPVFFEGIEDIKKGENKKGYTKVVGSSGAFALGKAGIEGLIESSKTKDRQAALKAIKRVAGVRGVLGTASGALTAAGVAKSQRSDKKDKKPESAKKRFLVPAIVGGGIGGAKGAIEELAVTKGRTTSRNVAAKASGRGAAGVLGALAISEIARKLSKDKEKKAEASPAGLAIPGTQPMPSMAPNPSEIYARTREISREQNTSDLQGFLKGQKDPERTPSRRAVTYAVNDELRRRGEQVPDEKIRSTTHPPMVPGTTLLHTAAAAAVVAAPSVVWAVGLDDLAVPQKDGILRDAMDRMIAAEGIEQIDAGIDWKDRLRFDRSAKAYYINFGSGDLDPDKVIKGTGEEADRVRAAIREGKRRFISSGKHRDPFIQAHELGHATAGRLRKKTIASTGSQIAYEAAKIPAIVLPLLALDSAADKSFHTPEEIRAKAKFAERVGLVALALGTPHLAEEATASAKGLKYLRRGGASTAQLARGAATRLAPAFATYAAPFATGALVGQVLRARARKAESKAKKQK